MKDLFYSNEEKILFYIAGYTQDHHLSNVVEMTTDLMNNAIKFANEVGCDLSQVKTTFIEKSSRYKYMRVFYINSDEPKLDAFELGGDWTMWKWLEN